MRPATLVAGSVVCATLGAADLGVLSIVVVPRWLAPPAVVDGPKGSPLAVAPTEPGTDVKTPTESEAAAKAQAARAMADALKAEAERSEAARAEAAKVDATAKAEAAKAEAAQRAEAAKAEAAERAEAAKAEAAERAEAAKAEAAARAEAAKAEAAARAEAAKAEAAAKAAAKQPKPKPDGDENLLELTGSKGPGSASKGAAVTLRFDLERTDIGSEAHGQLQRLLGLAGPADRFRIEGHADASGREEGNKYFSRERAKAVARELVHLGVAPARISTTSFGSTRPLVPGRTPAAFEQNRRVEVFLERSSR